MSPAPVAVLDRVTVTDEGRPPPPGARVTGAVALVSVPVAAFAVPDPTAGPLAYLGSVLLAAGFVTLAVRAVPRTRRRPWLGMLAMMYLSVAGETWFAVLDLRGSDQWPTGADAVYLSAYAALAWSVLALDRQRHWRPALGGLLDAGIVTASIAVLALVFLVGPLIADPGQTLAAKIIGSLYPLMDVMLAYLVARMLVGMRRHTAAIWWIVAAMLVTLTADTAQNVIVLTGGDGRLPRWMDAAWLLFYVLIGYGATSAHHDGPAETGPVPDGGLTAVRLVVLGLAAGMPALVQVTLAGRGDTSQGVSLAPAPSCCSSWSWRGSGTCCNSYGTSPSNWDGWPAPTH